MSPMSLHTDVRKFDHIASCCHCRSLHLLLSLLVTAMPAACMNSQQVYLCSPISTFFTSNGCMSGRKCLSRCNLHFVSLQHTHKCGFVTQVWCSSSCHPTCPVLQAMHSLGHILIPAGVGTSSHFQVCQLTTSFQNINCRCSAQRTQTSVRSSVLRFSNSCATPPHSWGPGVFAAVAACLHRDRVNIVVTQLPSLAQVGITDFKSKADLINVAMASSHIPIFLDMKVARKCRGSYCVDGSFPDFFYNEVSAGCDAGAVFQACCESGDVHCRVPHGLIMMVIWCVCRRRQ